MLLGFAGVVIFGATLPMMHIALSGMSPWFITFARAVIAATAAIPFILLGRHRLATTDIPEIFIAGVLLAICFPGFAALAMQTVPASHGGVILGLLPLMTASFAALIGGERPGALFWCLGVLGALIVVTFSLLESDLTLTIGDFWLLAAGLSTSFGYVLMARVSRRMGPGATISWALVLTLPISIAGVGLTWKAGLAEPSTSALWALAYLGYFSMFGGFFFWNAGLVIGGIARVSQIQLLQTFVTLALSALLLNEHISITTFLFAVAVGAVVWLGRKARIA